MKGRKRHRRKRHKRYRRHRRSRRGGGIHVGGGGVSGGLIRGRPTKPPPGQFHHYNPPGDITFKGRRMGGSLAGTIAGRIGTLGKYGRSAATLGLGAAKVAMQGARMGHAMLKPFAY